MLSLVEQILAITVGLLNISKIPLTNKDCKHVTRKDLFSKSYHAKQIYSQWRYFTSCQVSMSLLTGSLIIQTVIDLQFDTFSIIKV